MVLNVNIQYLATVAIFANVQCINLTLSAMHCLHKYIKYIHLSVQVHISNEGRFNPQPLPGGVTQCKKDSSTNGTRVCSRPVQNNCQGGFKIGGNCNGQERLDNTKLPQSEFQMGDEQVECPRSDWLC